MSKKAQPPRDSAGRFSKTAPPPSSLATPVPAEDRISSRPPAVSSAPPSHISTPSAVPGSFPSPLASSPSPAEPINASASFPYPPPAASVPLTLPTPVAHRLPSPVRSPTPPQPPVPPPTPPTPVTAIPASVPTPPPALMSRSASIGPAAMPGPRSPNAPYFSGQPNDPLADFLNEYDMIATGHGLTDQQKVDCILRYIPYSMRDLWKTLDGFSIGNWTTFQAALDRLYPDTAAATRYTRQGLMDFVDMAARSRMNDEDDVMQYYRRFLTIGNPLRLANQISEEDYSAEFFRGFHPDDREVLASRLFSMKPHHPPQKPYEFNDVFTAARGYFSNAQFYRPLQRRVREEPSDPVNPRATDPDRWMQRLFGREDRDPRPLWQDRDSLRDRERDRRSQLDRDRDMPASRQPQYETRTVHLREQDPKPQARGDEDTDLADLVTKLHGLSVRDPTYAVLYAQCKLRFPQIAQDLVRPELFQAASTVAYQAPASQAWAQPAAASAPAPAASTASSSFFRRPARTDGCAFCAQRGHMVRSCPAAEEYVRTGRALIKNDRLHLPTGESIPNDGSGRGLKSAIDAWLAANSTTRPGELTTTPPSPAVPDPHPRSTLSFEAVRPAVHRAYITPVPDDEDDSSSSTGELYNMYEVFAAERKKREPKLSKLPEATPAPAPPPAPPITPPAGHSRAPQYRYQSTAADQKLTDELRTWLLEGKLAQTTPAHILAASAPIRKDLVERLRTRRVEAAAFEECADPTAPVSVLGISAPRTAEYDLPLREVDVLVNGSCIESGVLDNGSQIVAIHVDLFRQLNAPINTEHRLTMEGANRSTSLTLGCAENLNMRIGNMDFQLHAHVVQTAPFRLLLGRPFFNLLLARLEDQPDGDVDLLIRDPADFAHSITVPTRARLTQVGYINTFALQARPSPPRMAALEQYITNASSVPPDAEVLAYKKAAKKVHPVAASLPEDFRIIRRRPEDPLLSLPPLPTHPPPFTPGSRLTQERLDDLDLNRYQFL
jgi:hypothetical protein